MEVHHHPKVEKKNFKEYFFEFIMIFLAVSMGFFAESLHEHYNNADVEKHNMESLVKNLQEDSVNLIRAISDYQSHIKTIDSLEMLNGSFHDSAFQKQFFNYAEKLVYYSDYIPDESAFEQMKSSGTLRLIKRQNITDSILKYIQQNKYTVLQQSYVDKFFNSAGEILLNVSDFRRMYKDNQFKLTGSDKQVQQYLNYKLAERIATVNYLNEDLNVQLANVRILIPFLKKEYNIK